MTQKANNDNTVHPEPWKGVTGHHEGTRVLTIGLELLGLSEGHQSPSQFKGFASHGLSESMHLLIEQLLAQTSCDGSIVEIISMPLAAFTDGHLIKQGPGERAPLADQWLTRVIAGAEALPGPADPFLPVVSPVPTTKAGRTGGPPPAAGVREQ